MNLAQLPFFKPFSPALRQELLDVGEVKEYTRGELIFQAGENESDFNMLVQVRIPIYKFSEGEPKRILRRFVIT